MTDAIEPKMLTDEQHSLLMSLEHRDIPTGWIAHEHPVMVCPYDLVAHILALEEWMAVQRITNRHNEALEATVAELRKKAEAAQALRAAATEPLRRSTIDGKHHRSVPNSAFEDVDDACAAFDATGKGGS